MSVMEIKNKLNNFLLEIKYNLPFCFVDLCGKAVISFK